MVGKVLYIHSTTYQSVNESLFYSVYGIDRFLFDVQLLSRAMHEERRIGSWQYVITNSPIKIPVFHL